MIARYVTRWSIEPVFFNAWRILGVGEARSQLRSAVERTVPFGLITHSLVTLWYTRSGHGPEQINRLSHSRPLVHHQVRSSLRRHNHHTQTRHHRHLRSAPSPYRLQPEKIRAVLMAWAAAET